VTRVAGVLAVALVAVGPAFSAPSQSRVIDVTLLCKVPGIGIPDPIRQVTVAASPRRGGKFSPSVSAHQGTANAEGWSVGIGTSPAVAGAPGVVLTRTGCAETRTKVALSPGRLPGGRTRLGERHVCDAPSSVVVRFRAVFRRPTAFRPVNGVSIARGRIVEVSLVVADRRGRPISFGSAEDATGRASSFVDRSRCEEAR
jgi:hypothetical protein